MNPIITAILSVTVIGIVCAIILSIASKVMAVKVDPRVAQIRSALPGANCGACGYAGCDGYAAALVSGLGVKTNLCTPGGDDVSRSISDVLGVGFEDVIEQVAVVHCCGDNKVTGEKMQYDGIETCAASKLLGGGKNACAYGCIGFGDCERACPYDAICIENGLARVNTNVCTGCGVCVATCPNGIISLERDTIREVVMCSNKDKGAVTRKVCSTGCIACKKCERACPVEAITVENNVASIDYDKCIACGKCVDECPVHCISEADYRGVNSQDQEKGAYVQKEKRSR